MSGRVSCSEGRVSFTTEGGKLLWEGGVSFGTRKGSNPEPFVRLSLDLGSILEGHRDVRR